MFPFSGATKTPQNFYMRTRLLLFAIVISAGALSTGYGALYTVSNIGTPADSNGIAPTGLLSDPLAVPAVGTFTGFQSPGNPGILGLGIFTISDAQITGATNLSSLVSAFSQFGASGTFGAAGPTGNKGLFSLATSGTVTATSFDTKSIYVFVGNGTTFANSTELLILKTIGTSFTAAQDGSPTPLDITITTANMTLLFGRNLADVKTTTADATTNAGWGTAAIPEPSSLILVMLGSLALLRRRR